MCQITYARCRDLPVQRGGHVTCDPELDLSGDGQCNVKYVCLCNALSSQENGTLSCSSMECIFLLKLADKVVKNGNPVVRAFLKFPKFKVLCKISIKHVDVSSQKHVS